MKSLLASSELLAPLLGNLCIFNDSHSPLESVCSLLISVSLKVQTDQVGQVCIGFIKITHLHYVPITLNQFAVDQCSWPIFLNVLRKFLTYLINKAELHPDPHASLLLLSLYLNT